MNEWKALIGYEGLYEINKYGNIKIIKGRYKNQILSSKIDTRGYWRVKVSKNGITRTINVHRLLAQTFILNPNNKGNVNHINGVKSDNRLENLEWVTHSENILHAYKNNLIKKNFKAVIDKCTGTFYASAYEAATAIGIKVRTLRDYMTGRIKTNPTCLEYQIV